MLNRSSQHLAHFVIVISLVTRQVECQEASGTVGALSDSINSNCVYHNSQEIEQESCIRGETPSQAETIHKMPKARGIKQIGTAHVQREG